MLNHTPETISFLEETLARFIGDNDLWDMYKSNRKEVESLFIEFAIKETPGIEIT